MSGEVRRLRFSEGVITSGPTQYLLGSLSFAVFANEADFLTAKGTALENGDAFYGSDDDNFFFASGGAFHPVGSDPYSRSAIVDLSNGESSKSITFSSPVPDGNFTIDISFFCPDSPPIFLQRMITAQSSTGFDVVFNAQTDSANYKLHYSTKGFA